MGDEVVFCVLPEAGLLGEALLEGVAFWL